MSLEVMEVLGAVLGALAFGAVVSAVCYVTTEKRWCRKFMLVFAVMVALAVLAFVLGVITHNQQFLMEGAG